MVTKILGGNKRSQKLYLREWIKERSDDSVERFAERVGVHRKTAYAWIAGRFPPLKYHGAIEAALSLDRFGALYSPPSRPSLDAITTDLPDDIHGEVVELVRRYIRRAS